MAYVDLVYCADKVSAMLCSHGVDPDIVVALQLLRSREMVVSVISVLRAGSAYLPIDPKWPLSRLFIYHR